MDIVLTISVSAEQAKAIMAYHDMTHGELEADMRAEARDYFNALYKEAEQGGFKG